MKRPILMVMLLVAGALALVYFFMWVPPLLLFLGWFPIAATGSGGIGSVSAGLWGEVFAAPILVLVSSFLLWRACTSLAAGGDRVMAWHRRFHGRAAIGGALLTLSAVGLGALALAMFPPDFRTEGGDWTWILALAAIGLFVASFGVNVMQLYSVVAAFRTLMRRAS